MSTAAHSDPLVEIDDLAVVFRRDGAAVRAVRGVSTEIRRGETLGVVGESGSGKSVFARTVMGLTATDPGSQVTGTVRFEGEELTGRSARELRKYWGTDVAMVFQDPQASLNPVRTIGSHLQVPLRLHLGMSRRAAKTRALELLELVGIPEPARRLRQYPHELSGGMRQRVMVALAVSCEPKLLIADEPTTALDVTVQRQVLDLIDRLAAELHMAVVLITHDLAVVAGRADRIAVMYSGQIVEEATVAELFANPRHPYTRALIDSVPTPGGGDRRLRSIPGAPPDPTRVDPGCPFAPRCPESTDRCVSELPALTVAVDEPGRRVRCHHPLVGVPSHNGGETIDG